MCQRCFKFCLKLDAEVEKYVACAVSYSQFDIQASIGDRDLSWQILVWYMPVWHRDVGSKARQPSVSVCSAKNGIKKRQADVYF